MTVAGRTVLLALSGALLASCDQVAQGRADPTAAQVGAVFEAYMQGASPGAAVLVARDEEVVFKAAYGLADLEARRPLEPNTPIRLGSLTKQFTAVAIMLLAEEGVLAFDDPAARWVPELERFEPITIRHLLNHTSGLPDYYDRIASPEAAASGPRRTADETLLTTAEAVEIYSDWGDLEFPTGSAYQYSNPGYEVLGLIVERASGRSYADFMEQRIFGPLSMTRTAVRDSPDRLIPDRAIGYEPTDGEAEWVELDDHPLNWILGAGGIYASVEDLALWDAALTSRRILISGTLAEAHTPATLSGGEVHPYGFGWSVAERLGRPAFHHTGGWVGFRTAMAHFVEEDLMVVVLSNASGPAEDLMDQVASLYLGGAGTSPNAQPSQGSSP